MLLFLKYAKTKIFFLNKNTFSEVRAASGANQPEEFSTSDQERIEKPEVSFFIYFIFDF